MGAEEDGGTGAVRVGNGKVFSLEARGFGHADGDGKKGQRKVIGGAYPCHSLVDIDQSQDGGLKRKAFWSEVRIRRLWWRTPKTSPSARFDCLLEPCVSQGLPYAPYGPIISSPSASMSSEKEHR